MDISPPKLSSENTTFDHSNQFAIAISVLCLGDTNHPQIHERQLFSLREPLTTHRLTRENNW
jgi:hypothetical protein